MFLQQVLIINLMILCFSFLLPATPPIKALHITFHRGCANEFAAVANHFGLQLDTWFIPELPEGFLDRTTLVNNALYNVGHARAKRIWESHKDTFEKFDLIITSDTTPLARIFLQNPWKKPLIIWVCNRFDYADLDNRDCDFPDQEFYELIQQARERENVSIVAYTAFETYYANQKGIDFGELVITPCAPNLNPELSQIDTYIPDHIIKQETFLLPPYHNEKKFMNLSEKCATLEIPTFCGTYLGPLDIKDFKGIIHLPYSWSTLALFENIALGIPYFIPSPVFFKELASKENYFHPDLNELLEKDLFYLSEWYGQGREQIFIHFDSWEDLQEKTSSVDYLKVKENTLRYAKDYKRTMLARWEAIFRKVTVFKEQQK